MKFQSPLLALACGTCAGPARRGRQHPAAAHGGALGALRRLRCVALPWGRAAQLATFAALGQVRRVSPRNARCAPTPDLRSSPPQKSPLPRTACREVQFGSYSIAHHHRIRKVAPGRAAVLRRSRRCCAPTALRRSALWPVAQPAALTAFATLRQGATSVSTWRAARAGHKTCARRRPAGPLPPVRARLCRAAVDLNRFRWPERAPPPTTTSAR
jgi:hypothetical protein